MVGVSSLPCSEASRCCPSILLPSLSPPIRAPSALNPRSLTGPRLRGAVSCSSRTPGSSSSSSSSDENESKAVLDAFFLGKALAEALNERVGSTVGEFLSVIGQWQAEQQKQVRDFQEEVIERAKKAKEKAALEATEDQGIISKSLTPLNIVTPNSYESPGLTSEDPLQEKTED